MSANASDVIPDSALASVAPDPQATATSDIIPESALAPYTISGSGAQKQKQANLYDSNRPTIGQGLEDQLHGMGSGLYHSIVGGYKGLAELATTRNINAAADAVHSETSQIFQPPPPSLSDVPESIRPAIVKSHETPPITALGDWASSHGASPGLSTGLAVLPAAVATLFPGKFQSPAMSAEDVTNAAAARQSGGAAGASPNISMLPDPIKAKLAATDPTKVDLMALQNHIEANQLGIDLMKGQANRDPIQYSAEQNNSTIPKIADRLNSQNGQMVDAMDNIRRDAGPNTVQNNPVQNGQLVVDDLKAYDEPVKADIQAKYKALTDANGGTIPIDPGQFTQNVRAQLKTEYLEGNIPAAGQTLLNRMEAGGTLDFGGYEAAIRRLSEAQAGGGSEAAAAKIIRNNLEQLPLSPAASRLQGLADTARAAARARFQALDADPAYQAAVDDVANGVKRGQPSPLADRFIDNYALSKSAPKANVDLMMQKLGADGAEAVASHTLNTVRNGMVSGAGQNVKAAGLHSAIDRINTKIDSLLPADVGDKLGMLDRQVTNVKVAPPGSSVNYAKSAVIMNAAQGIGEGYIQSKTLGMGVPALKGIVRSKFVNDALEPGAGISK